MRMLDKNRANVVFVDCPFFFSVILKHKKQPPRCVCVLSIAGGVQPFVIASRITFNYMKYGRQ